VIPPDREARVLQAALDACRAVTRTHIELPNDESAELTLGVDSPWDGYARYQGLHRTIIGISGRSPLDLTRALHLACHEGYPGHHLQHVLIDDALVRGRRWLEFQLAPAFGPHLLIAEGAAEAGAALAFPPDRRAELYRDVLFPLAGLSRAAAERLIDVEELSQALQPSIADTLAAYLDSNTSRAATAAALVDKAAVLDPEALISMAERRRTVLIAYSLGRSVVEPTLYRDGGEPWSRLVALFSESPFALQ
jgi:hypothetical protein